MTELEKSVIGEMEPFDCDVEEALDQVTMDPKTRGKIRFMLMELVNNHIYVEMKLRGRIKELEALRDRT